MTRQRRTRRGQALVEFALLLPFLLLLLLGVIEMGRAWNVKQVLTDAAREGARLAVVADPTMTQARVDSLIYRVIARAGLDTTALTIGYPDGFKTGVGNITAVELSIPYQFVALHNLAALVTNNGVMTLRTTARMRNE